MANGDRPWREPTQIDAEDMAHGRRNRWQPLYDDIIKRLEQTTSRFALAYPFDDIDEAQLAYGALKARFERHDPHFAELSTRKGENGSGVLYVRRGPAWTK